MNQNISVENAISIIQSYSNNCIAGLNDNVQEIFNEYFPFQNNEINNCEKLINEILLKANNNAMPHSFYQEFFDYLMVLNIEKKIISPLYLINFLNQYSLEENLEQYYDKIFGITYLEYDDNQKSDCLNNYFEWKKIIELCKKNNIEMSSDISSLSSNRLISRFEFCEKKVFK